METTTKLQLGGLALLLFAEGWRSASLDALPRVRDPIERLDFAQKAQGLEILSLVGSGLFWTGTYKKYPKTVVGLGIAATALAYAPRFIKWLDPKGYEEAMEATFHPRHRVPAPMTPVVTSGEFTGAPRHLYRARHPFELQNQQDQQQYHHPHHQHHHR